VNKEEIYVKQKKQKTHTGMKQKQEFAGVSLLDSKQAIMYVIKTVPALLAVSIAVGAPPLAALITASMGGIVMAFASIVFDNWRTRRTSVNWPLLAVMAVAIANLGYAPVLLVFIASGFMIALLSLTPIAYWIGKTVSPVILAGVLAALSLTTIVNQIPVWLGLGVSTAPIWTSLWHIITSIDRIDAVSMMIGVAGLFMLGLYRALRQDAKPTDTIHRFPILLLVLVLTSIVAMLTGSATVPTAWQMQTFDLDVLFMPQAWNYIAIIAVLSIAQLCSQYPHKSLALSNTIGSMGIGGVVSGLLGGLPMATKLDQEPSTQDINSQRIFVDFLNYALIGVLFAVLMFVPGSYIGTTGAAIVTMAVLYRYTRLSLYQDIWHQGMQTTVVFAIAFVLSLVTEWVLVAILIAELVDAFWTYKEMIRPQYAFKISHHKSNTAHNIYITPGDSFDEKQGIQAIMEIIPTQEPVTIQVLPMARQQIAKHAHLSPRVRALLRDIVDQHQGPIVIQDADGRPLLSDGIQDDYPIVPHKTHDGWEYRPISTQ
jgi:MFS superfamily sulfate permease-like transporter